MRLDGRGIFWKALLRFLIILVPSMPFLFGLLMTGLSVVKAHGMLLWSLAVDGYEEELAEVRMGNLEI